MRTTTRTDMTGERVREHPRPALQLPPLQLLFLLAAAPRADQAGAAGPCSCPADPLGCPGDLCCSLNGRLQSNGACACRKPWHGDRCHLLGFKPVDLDPHGAQGYGMR